MNSWYGLAVVTSRGRRERVLFRRLTIGWHACSRHTNLLVSVTDVSLTELTLFHYAAGYVKHAAFSYIAGKSHLWQFNWLRLHREMCVYIYSVPWHRVKQRVELLRQPFVSTRERFGKLDQVSSSRVIITARNPRIWIGSRKSYSFKNINICFNIWLIIV